MTIDDAPAPSRRERRMRSGTIDVPSGAGGRPEPDLEADTRAVPIAAASADVDGTTAVIAEPPFDTDATTVLRAADTAATDIVGEPRTDPTAILLAPDDGHPVDRLDAAAPADASPVALAWLDETTVAPIASPHSIHAADGSDASPAPDLLADAPRRSPLRPGVLVPTGVIALVLALYAATTLLWPLHAVAPTVTALTVAPAAAPTAEMSWPGAGSAAVAVAGISGVVSSTADTDTMASITKVVTALVVLDELPLAVGEQGPEYWFDYSDTSDYWGYRYRGESALDVPVGGSLTEYQMLEGMLIGSANNYADRLAHDLFGSDDVFADAAAGWLDTHGLDGITVVEPTGMDWGNAASAAALVPLAQKALANPVIAEIVAKKSVDLPGAGTVENTNGLLADEGVLGIKTGTLDVWNLLSAKQITVGETPVRLYASVLGQPDDDARLAASRDLYTQLETQLQLVPSVPTGTVAGIVETAWGDSVDIVTDGDASVVLWNGGAGEVTTSYDLGESRESGDAVGSLAVTGPLDSASVDLRLASDIEPPSAWWRLTHPLELFGLAG